jgi:hypothetical protein
MRGVLGFEAAVLGSGGRPQAEAAGRKGARPFSNRRTFAFD